MGRKPINIELIQEDRNRQVTFNKRKAGLIKKAMELSILSGCQIQLVIFSPNNELHEFTSNGDSRGILQKYCKVAHLPHELVTNADYDAKVKAAATKKSGKKRVKSADSAPSSGDEGTMMDTTATVAAANSIPSQQQVLQQQQPQQLQGLLQLNNGYEAVSSDLMQQLASLPPVLQQGHFQQSQQAQQLFQMASSEAIPQSTVQVHMLQQEGEEETIEQGSVAVQNGPDVAAGDLLQEPMTPKTAAFISSHFSNVSFAQQQKLQQELQRQQLESQNRIPIHEPRAKRPKIPELNVNVPPRAINIPLRAGGYIPATAPPTPNIDSLLISPTSELQSMLRTPTTPSGGL